MVHLQVDIDGRAMADPAWRDAAVSFFSALARAAGAFYAIGYVESGIETKGRTLYFTGSSETYPLPRHSRWLGIPGVPTWLTWYGRPYAEAVQSACESYVTKRFDEGFLIRASDEPRRIGSLPKNTPKIPPELRAKISRQSLSGRLASLLQPKILPSGDHMTDTPADFIPPLD